MPNRTSNGRRYDCQLSLSNIGFGLLKRRETARSFSPVFHRQRVSLPGETLLEQSRAHQSA